MKIISLLAQAQGQICAAPFVRPFCSSSCSSSFQLPWLHALRQPCAAGGLASLPFAGLVYIQCGSNLRRDSTSSSPSTKTLCRGILRIVQRERKKKRRKRPRGRTSTRRSFLHRRPMPKKSCRTTRRTTRTTFTSSLVTSYGRIFPPSQFCPSQRRPWRHRPWPPFLDEYDICAFIKRLARFAGRRTGGTECDLRHLG